MKRCAYLVIFLCFALLASPIFAATPTPTPTPATSIPVATPATGGVYNEQISLLQSATATESALQVESEGAAMGTTFQIPDLAKQAQALSGAAPYLLPLDINQNIKPQENNQFISGTTKVYVEILGQIIDIPFLGVGKFKTQLIPEWAQLLQGSKQLQFLIQGQSLAPDTEGKYDVTSPPEELDETPDLSGKSTGKAQPTSQTAVAQKYGSYPSWKRIFETIAQSIKITFASKTLLPHASDAYTKAKGLAANYAPITLDITKGEPLNGEETNELVAGKQTTTRTENTNGILNAINLQLCSVLSLDAQKQQGINCDNYARKTDLTQIDSLTCKGSVLDSMTPDPGKYAGFKSTDRSNVGFSIPMHNTNCTISDAGITGIANLAYRWTGQNKDQAKENVLTKYKTIEEYAQKFGWNPAFLIALWIEETAAGSIGGQEMGCVYNFGTNPATSVPVTSDTCDQMACIFNYLIRTSTSDFLCSYAGKVWKTSSTYDLNCTTFIIDEQNNNKCFPSNVRGIYQEVVTMGGMDSSCAPQGQTADWIRKECPGNEWDK